MSLYLWPLAHTHVLFLYSNLDISLFPQLHQSSLGIPVGYIVSDVKSKMSVWLAKDSAHQNIVTHNPLARLKIPHQFWLILNIFRVLFFLFFHVKYRSNNPDSMMCFNFYTSLISTYLLHMISAIMLTAY